MSGRRKERPVQTDNDHSVICQAAAVRQPFVFELLLRRRACLSSSSISFLGRGCSACHFQELM